jgi:hypothetical protein
LVQSVSRLKANIDAAYDDNVQASTISPSDASEFSKVTFLIPSGPFSDADSFKGFLRKYVLMLSGSNLFRRSSGLSQSYGAVVVTWDKAPGSGKKVGAVVLSPFAKLGGATTSTYDTYGLLRTIEERLGIAKGSTLIGDHKGAAPFGEDVFPKR